MAFAAVISLADLAVTVTVATRSAERRSNATDRFTSVTSARAVAGTRNVVTATIRAVSTARLRVRRKGGCLHG
ncbi:hypothetical protein BJF79_27320 [Actinomadura sp. CNU-125]|nr:hypothetical protein BJF79_27320 [Actinomadura sp. CNU-125]